MELINSDISEKSPECNIVPTLRQIACEVAEKYGLTLPLMRCNRRLGPISAARFEFYYRAINETGKTLSEVGRFLGVDHTTVNYGMTRYCVRHHLPLPNGFKGYRKAFAERFYPMDLYNCYDPALRQIQRLQQEINSNR